MKRLIPNTIASNIQEAVLKCNKLYDFHPEAVAETKEGFICFVNYHDYEFWFKQQQGIHRQLQEKKA